MDVHIENYDQNTLHQIANWRIAVIFCCQQLKFGCLGRVNPQLGWYTWETMPSTRNLIFVTSAGGPGPGSIKGQIWGHLNNQNVFNIWACRSN